MHAIQAEEERKLRQALERLPEDQRRAVHLMYLEGRPVREISRRLGRTEASVRGLIRRAKQKLRPFLHLT